MLCEIKQLMWNLAVNLTRNNFSHQNAGTVKDENSVKSTATNSIFNEFLIQENKLIATIPFNEQH